MAEPVAPAPESSPPPAPTPAPASRRQKLQRELWRRVYVVLVVLGTATVLAGAARWHWFADLFTAFRAQYAVGLFLCAAACLAGRRWRTLAVAAPLLALNLWFIMPCWFRALPIPPADAQRHRAILFNVHCQNTSFAAVRQFLLAENPEFFVIEEYTEAWRQELAVLEKEYPYLLARQSDDSFGIAVFSRHPFTGQVIYLPGCEVPSLGVELKVDGRPLTLLATHPLPSLGETRTAGRNRQLVEIATWVNARTGPRLVLGDLNCVPWAPVFRDLCQRTGLREARRGFGLKPTWPVHNWLAAVFWVPIDHVLASPDFAIANFRTGPRLGSDHRAVIVDFAWSAAPPQATAPRADP